MGPRSCSNMALPNRMRLQNSPFLYRACRYRTASVRVNRRFRREAQTLWYAALRLT